MVGQSPDEDLGQHRVLLADEGGVAGGRGGGHVGGDVKGRNGDWSGGKCPLIRTRSEQAFFRACR